MTYFHCHLHINYRMTNDKEKGEGKIHTHNWKFIVLLDMKQKKNLGLSDAIYSNLRRVISYPVVCKSCACFYFEEDESQIDDTHIAYKI